MKVEVPIHMIHAHTSDKHIPWRRNSTWGR